MTVSAAPAPLAHSDPIGDAQPWYSRALAWWAYAVIALCAILAVRLALEPRFFFWDDTQLGAFGQWYGLGSRILSGDVTILNPGAWQGGNYLAEGQWGLWNPATWLIALGTHAIGNATALATLVKLVFLILLVTGVFLLARSFRAAPWWAALAGLAAAMNGQTVFMDTPSWVTGLQATALFVLAWWALKRHVDDGREPFTYFVITYLLVTLGYVFGAMELAVVLVASLIEQIARRRRVGIVRVLVLGAYAALLTVFVYLPGVLTASVTIRSGEGIANDQFLGLDLSDLAMSSISTATGAIDGYWGQFSPVPLQYATWLLPLIVLLSGWRIVARGLFVPAVVFAGGLALVLGPTVLGPLRYPVRMMPYVVIGLVVILAMVATVSRRPSRTRVLWAVGLTVLSAWFGWAARPETFRWVALACALQVVLVLVIFWPRSRVRRPYGGRAAAAALVAGSVLVLVPQAVEYPSSPLGNFNVPSSTSQLAAVGDPMPNGIITVGDVYSLSSHPDSYSESLLANLWYLTGKDTASVYTVLLHRALARDLCVDLRGATCPRAVTALFEGPEPRLVDDMALNTVVVIKGEGLEDRPTAAPGWTVREREYTWLITRDDPVPSAGGVARTTPGVQAVTTARDDLSTTIVLDAVPADGGRVTFSRLAWPGYETTAGNLSTDPDRGFLLTLDVGAEDVGKQITVRYRPPGWTLELGSLGLAGLVLVGWGAAFVITRRRASRTDQSGSGDAAVLRGSSTENA